MKRIGNFYTNNFDLVRLIAALLVLTTHGYELVGNLKDEPFYILTNNRSRFSTIGLYLFFFTSGYLVTNSFFQTKKTGEFIWKRFLRIYPGLFTVIIITTFIIGPLFTTDLENYFSNSVTYQYLFTASGIHIKYSLPGVFEGVQHYDHGVNGSLWSIGLEVKLYIMLILAGAIYKKGIKNIFHFIFLPVFLFTVLVSVDAYHLQNYFDPVHTNMFLVFWIGNLCCLHYKKIILNIYILLVLCAAWAFTIYYYQPLEVIIEPVFFSYLTLFICYTPKTVSLKIDLSFGTYIYAFLITQVIIEIAGKISPLQMIFLTLICVIPVSFLSWTFIERKALNQKKKYYSLFGEKST